MCLCVHLDSSLTISSLISLPLHFQGDETRFILANIQPIAYIYFNYVNENSGMAYY